MEWSMVASVFWKVLVGILLLVLSVLAGFLCSALGSIRKSLENIQNTMKSTEGLIDTEVTTLIRDVNHIVTEVKNELPELLENLNGIAASVREMSKAEIRPTARNIQQMTETINQNVAKLDELVNVVVDFSQQTVKRARYYRDQFSTPITDIISAWEGFKRGFEVFSRFRKTGKSDSGSNS